MLWPHCPNKNVFSNRLNWPYDSPHSLRLGGSLFQICGPAAAKVLSPKLLRVRNRPEGEACMQKLFLRSMYTVSVGELTIRSSYTKLPILGKNIPPHKNLPFKVL